MYQCEPITHGLVPFPPIICWCNAMNLTVISIRRTAIRGGRTLGSRRSTNRPIKLFPSSSFLLPRRITRTYQPCRMYVDVLFDINRSVLNNRCSIGKFHFAFAFSQMHIKYNLNAYTYNLLSYIKIETMMNDNNYKRPVESSRRSSNQHIFTNLFVLPIKFILILGCCMFT